jgi:hypothetical protein
MTHRFDPSNAEHMEVKKRVEFGNGIENLIVQDKVLDQTYLKSFDLI